MVKFFLFLILLAHVSFSWAGDAEDLEKTIEESAKNLQNISPIKDSDSSESIFDSKILENFKNQILETFAKESPFKGVDKKHVRSLLQAFLEGKNLGKTMEKYPKVLDFTSEVLVDDKALPSFFNILNRGEDLKLYLYISIGLFFLSLIISYYWTRANGVFVKFLKKLFLIPVFTLLNLGVFYFLFQENLAPMIKILKSYL